MKRLTQEMYETRFPYLNYEYFDALENKEEYLSEYTMYAKLFVMFLMKNTSIKRMENEIRDCKDFKYKIPGSYPEDQDLYQYLCNEDLEYFYIRNNIYVERLSQKEKEYLDSLINSKDFKFDSSAEKFVKDTFSRLIDEDPESKEGYYINYGPSGSRGFFAGSNSLVIGARMYPGMPTNDVTEFNKSYFKRMGFFRNKCEELEKVLKNELEVDVKVIEYDDESVHKLSFDEDMSL